MSFYETRENHPKEDLRTHYYTATLDQAYNAILKVAKDLNYEIISEDYNRREIFIEGDCSMVFTITSFGSTQAVDINCDTYSFIDFGKGRRRIKEFYAALARNVNFKGVGLHRS